MAPRVDELQQSAFQVEHACSAFTLVDLSPHLPTRGDRPHRTRDPKAICQAFVHQTQGNTRPGRVGLADEADFFIADDNPATKDVEGRGWGGFAYTFFVPYTPEFTFAGSPLLYRCQPDEAISNHTLHHRELGIGIAFQGLFRCKSAPNAGTPSAFQRGVFKPLLDHLFLRYGMSPIDAFCHSDAGKPDCPGFDLEQWVGAYRDSFLALAPLSLVTWEQRQRALVELCQLRPREVSGSYDHTTRVALERIETSLSFPVTGHWSRPVDTHVRHLLQEKTP